MNEIQGLIVIVITIALSLTLHELMHALVAFRLGDDTAHRMGRISLNPLDHVDVFTTLLLPLSLYLIGAPPFGAAKPVPINSARLKYDELGAALVAFAGPLTNLALAVASASLIKFGVLELDTTLGDSVLLFSLTNVGFFVFNMIPFPPLDGSRVLYAVAPDPIKRIMDQIESLGFVAIMIFMLVFYQFISPIISRITLMIAGSILG